MPSTSDVSGSGLPDESPLQESSGEDGGGVCPEQIIGRHLSVVGNRQGDIPPLLDLLHEVIPLQTTIEEFPAQRNERAGELGTSIVEVLARQMGGQVKVSRSSRGTSGDHPRRARPRGR
jgi:hypothetical protein